jgi:hypothetical protein
MECLYCKSPAKFKEPNSDKVFCSKKCQICLYYGKGNIISEQKGKMTVLPTGMWALRDCCRLRNKKGMHVFINRKCNSTPRSVLGIIG